MLAFFHKIIDVLDSVEIPYMLSGSVAQSMYVVPRSTRDFDFVVQLQQKNVEAFAACFEKDYYCHIPSIQDAIKSKGMFNIIDHASGYKADFVILKNESFRIEEFARKKKVQFLNRPVFIVSPEDLVLSKLIWIQTYQSSIQMDDIQALLTLENLDLNYIRHWIKQLKIHTFNLL
jgi:hypothetical protein